MNWNNLLVGALLVLAAYCLFKWNFPSLPESSHPGYQTGAGHRPIPVKSAREHGFGR